MILALDVQYKKCMQNVNDEVALFFKIGTANTAFQAY